MANRPRSPSLPLAASFSQQPRRRIRRLGNDVVFCEEDQIGQGQFGTVFKGWSHRRRQPVAVKCFYVSMSSHGSAENVVSPVAATPLLHVAHISHSGGPSTRSSTEHGCTHIPPELRILWNLRKERCPNILEVHSMWNTSKGLVANGRRTYMIVTEYCAGGDLQRHLASKGKASEAAARSLIYQLANTLLLLKRCNIIHRDIKPANLLLTSGCLESAVLKVADWGMAKMARAVTTSEKPVLNDGCHLQDVDDAEQVDMEAVSASLFYSEMGTPMYMSPERIERQPYSYRADVYSAGMVLYELMTGHCVRATSASQLRTAVPDAVRRLLGRYGTPTPLWLDLLQGMTAADPDHRLSVEEVLQHPWFLPEMGPLPALNSSQPHPTTLTACVESIEELHLDRVSANLENATLSAVQSAADCTASVEMDAAVTPPSRSWEDVASFSTTSVCEPSPFWSVLAVEMADSSVGVDSRVVEYGCLPPACGPHIVTSAVSCYVETIMHYVVMAEQKDPCRAQRQLTFLVELLQSGYSVFASEIDKHGGPPQASGETSSASPTMSEGPVCSDHLPLRAVWNNLLCMLSDLARHHRPRCEGMSDSSLIGAISLPINRTIEGWAQQRQSVANLTDLLESKTGTPSPFTSGTISTTIEEDNDAQDTEERNTDKHNNLVEHRQAQKDILLQSLSLIQQGAQEELLLGRQSLTELRQGFRTGGGGAREQGMEHPTELSPAAKDTTCLRRTRYGEGLALLRVLAQQAVLTEQEVGLKRCLEGHEKPVLLLVYVPIFPLLLRNNVHLVDRIIQSLTELGQPS